MQDIQINVKGARFRLKFGDLNEENEGKMEETPEAAPQRKEYHSDHGKVYLPAFALFKLI